MAVLYGFDENNMALTAPPVTGGFDPSKVPATNKNARAEAEAFGTGFSDTMQVKDGKTPNVLQAVATGIQAMRGVDEGITPEEMKNYGKEGILGLIPGEEAPSLIVNPERVAKEEEAKKAIEKGGVLTPSADADPSVKINAMVQNQMTGSGDPLGDVPVPPPPTPREVADKTQRQQAKQIMMDQSKIPVWYESSSFYNGMLSMGLNLLAGKDIASSFAAGAQVFDRNFGIEKRRSWASDLRAAGYDDLEIEKYIETGDNKALTDPMERERQARQDALAEAQLYKAQWEADPTRLEHKDKVEHYKLKKDAESAAFDRKMRLDDLALRRRNMEMLELDRKDRRDIERLKASGQTEKYNESLSKAKNHYIRARQGNTNYQETEKRLAPKYDEKGWLGNMVTSKIIDMVFDGKETSTMLARTIDNDATEMITAEREFLAPLLRKDSGAAVSATEWRTTGEIYFPRPDDSPERRAQKRQAREVAVLAMNPQASPQLKEALEGYTTGQISGLRVAGSKVYANDGTGWYEVQQ